MFALINAFIDKEICELYDVVNMKPTSFKYKTRHALRTLSPNDEHFQTGTYPVDNSIPQNSKKSTPKMKKVPNRVQRPKPLPRLQMEMLRVSIL